MDIIPTIREMINHDPVREELYMFGPSKDRPRPAKTTAVKQRRKNNKAQRRARKRQS